MTVLVFFWATWASAVEPLHVRIDEAVDRASSGVSSPTVSDAEFLRRVSLDLAGVPPTSAELSQFLADPSPNKRAGAIDRLLASNLFPKHLAHIFDLMLMERRPAAAVSQDEWLAYLESSIESNKPLNQLFREILSADGVDPALRPAARFYLDRAGEANLITRDVGRMVFGRDLQCAQCHDSPLVDDYLQSDFKGLFAFFEGGVVVTRKEGDKEKSYYGERAAGDLSFESVFVKGKKHVTSARVPNRAQLTEPVYHPGDEYQTAPADGVVPVPKWSRRQQLAALATDGSNRAFNENLANRLWAHMMGRGLVHPVDMHHGGNPASYPEALALIASELAAMKFDLRGFLRELALTRVYQRSIDFPASLAEKASQASERLSKLEVERPALATELEQAQASYEACKERYQQLESALVPVADELAAARGKVAEIDKKVAEARKAQAEAESQLAKKVQVRAGLAEAIAKAQQVAGQLPEDKELTAATAKLGEQADRLAQEQSAQEKLIADKKAAVEAALAEWTTAKQQMDLVVARWQPLREPVQAMDGEWVQARIRMADAVTRLNRHDERTKQLKIFIDFKRAEEARSSSTAEVASVQSTMETVRQQMADQAMAIARKQLEVAQVEQKQAALDTELAQRTREQATAAESARLLAEAMSLVESAKQSMFSDPKIEPLVAMLEQKSGEARAGEQSAAQQLADAGRRREELARAMAAAREGLVGTLAENVKRFEGAQSVAAQLEQVQAKANASEAEAGAVEDKLQSVWSSDLTLATLKPLTPEQICWSILRITGVEERYQQAERAELEKSAPLSPEAARDPAQFAQRQKQIENGAYAKLKSAAGGFVAFFAAASGQPQSDFFATADQALFVSNDGTVNSWIAPTGGNVTERIIAQVDPRLAAEDLYLTVLSRRPTEQEIADVAQHLGKRASDKAVAAQELVWALVTSAEFRFNH